MSEDDLAGQFRAAYPGLFYLTADDPPSLEGYLRKAGLLGRKDAIASVTRAGESNMNCVLRVSLGDRSLIVKQARPWVEKYPSIAAPVDRVLGEARFYEALAKVPELAAAMPQLRHVDRAAFLLVIEDLGEARDYSSVYAGHRFAEKELVALASWLSQLHGLSFDADDRAPWTNRAMRALNHEHIFALPLRPDNGIDCDAFTPGLETAAQKLQTNTAYVETVTALGQLYQRDGSQLLHGDFFPGSILQTSSGPRIIDPEFAFLGPPELDVGVFLAHLRLSGHGSAALSSFLGSYEPNDEFSEELAYAFAGCEIMRRLIGVAQLPLSSDLAEKTTLLQQSVEWVEAAPAHRLHR